MKLQHKQQRFGSRIIANGGTVLGSLPSQGYSNRHRIPWNPTLAEIAMMKTQVHRRIPVPKDPLAPTSKYAGNGAARRQ